jgi:predicted lactoylglutathione lyase
MTQLFISLPVADLERSNAYYSALGFTINPAMSDHNGTCFVIEEGHSYLMVVAREFFQSFTERPIADPSGPAWGAFIVYLESRDAVDARIADGLAAGGTETQEPTDYGFMYQRQLTDPDGHVLEFGWMDANAANAEVAAHEA